MDTVALKEKITAIFQRYRYAILIVAIGLVLMSIPGREVSSDEAPAPLLIQTTSDTQSDLEQILSQIHGVGKAKVLLTVAAGEQTIYERNSDRTSDELSESLRVETVIITDANRAQQGLIQQVIPPTYQGAVIVCQGGDIPSVQLAIVEAVSDVTGLTADKITVLKMK